jgi:hypothetical protein
MCPASLQLVAPSKFVRAVCLYIVRQGLWSIRSTEVSRVRILNRNRYIGLCRILKVASVKGSRLFAVI